MSEVQFFFYYVLIIIKLKVEFAEMVARIAISRIPIAGLRLGEPCLAKPQYFRLARSQQHRFSTLQPLRNTTPSKPSSSGRDSLQAQMEAQRAETYKKRNQSLLMYTAAAFIVGIGVTYAAVPLYRAFCSATGFSGTPMVGLGRFSPDKLFPQYFDPATRSATKRIRVTFNADHSDALPWTFKPSQDEIYVLPGETALAFYKAKNKGDKDITGIATYNVAPDRIAPYFAKIECFCFEEQRLLANEDVDLPVFFFIDKDVLDDPTVRDVKDVVLSYSFFGARRNNITGQLEPDTDLEKYTVGKDL